MTKNLRWKILTIVAVLGLSIWAIYPLQQKILLGLDLKGGVHLVLRVQTDDALRVETEQSVERLREELNSRGIKGVTITATGPTQIRVEGVPPAQDATFRDIAQNVSGALYDRESGVSGQYLFVLKPNEAIKLREESVVQAIRTIDRRVNELGVTEPIVARHGGAGNQLLVQLPGVTDIPRAKEIIRETALLELKLVEKDPLPSEEALLKDSNGTVPSGMQVVPGVSDAVAPGERPETEYYLLRQVAAVTGRDLRNARQSLDDNNQPAVGFTLNKEGAKKFLKFTTENIRRRLAIVLDGRVISAPVIEDKISDDGIIRGNFTHQEASDLALKLRSGALPASLTYLEERTIGPTLGADSIRSGIIASSVGMALVVAFMLLYYKLSGVNAIVALVFNLIILLALMAYIGATMTLPGIAGFILTMGIGVDSNVLIFERIKEELEAQRGVRASIQAGFSRVFLTLLDTHIASLISAAFLFQFGTGPIRGFATTLSIGLLVNLFTSLFVSKTLFELALSRRQVATLSI